MLHIRGRRSPFVVKCILPAALALSALGVACSTPAAPGGGGGATGGSPEPGEPQHGGYLRQLLAYSAQDLDPYTTDDNTALGFISPQWYEGLTSIEYIPGEDWRVKNKVIPWLAESWKLENPTTYLFNIRRGVTFHNGDPLTADDVVFSYNRMFDPNLKVNPSVRAYLTNVASVEKVDDVTVRLVTKQPDPDTVVNLAARNVSILDKNYMESGGDIHKHPMGTGPFKLEKYQKDAEGLSTRYDGYWQKDRPYLDGIKMVLKADDSTMDAAAAAGQTDVATANDRQQFLPLQSANPNLQVEKFTINSLSALQINVARPPFNDVRVRRAIHLGLDREEMNKAMTFGEGIQTGPLIIAGKTGWTIPQQELLQLPGYRQPKDQDIAEARRLLAEAGYPDGFKTTLQFLPSIRVNPPGAQATQAQLKENLNIDLELVPLDSKPTWTQHDLKGEYDLMLTGMGYMDKPSVTAWAYFHSSGSFAKGAGINDPELDALIEAQGKEFDPEKRGAAFVQIQRLLLDKMYSVPLPQSILYQLWQPWVHDWVGNIGARPTIMNPWAIWIDLSQAPADRRHR